MIRRVLIAAILLGFPAMRAGADTGKMIAEIHARNAAALKTVRFTVEDETGTQTVTGVGICIDPRGVFMTTALNTRAPVGSLKDFQIVASGVDGKVTKAELLGIEPGTGLGFVRAIGGGTWTAVKFASPPLKVGQRVVSLGLMSKDMGFPAYVGVGYVSAVLRAPGDLVYVTGGRLTSPGSPVFDASGRAIGIVAEQLPVGYKAFTNRGAMNLALKGLQETAYFTPTREFAHVLRNIPSGGKARRLPWLGIGKFEWVNDATAKLRKLDRPGIMIDQVIPSHPADEVGLKNGDIIIAVDGRNVEKFPTPDLTVRNFRRQMTRRAVGEEVKLTVLAGTVRRDVTVKLASMPKLPLEAKRYFSRPLGFVVREKVMLDKYLDDSPTAEAAGLLVIAVAPRGLAARDGLRAGDLVSKVNGLDVTTVSGFKGVVERALAETPNRSVDLLVRRGNQAQEIKIRPSQR